MKRFTARGIALFRKITQSLFYRLTISIALLAAIYILLFSLVIAVAEDQLEVLSLHHWLDSEASKYRQEYALYGEQTALPNPFEFDSYWSENAIPPWLKNYTVPGFYEHHLGPEDKHFLVTPHPSGTGVFYVVFKDDADDYLDLYESRLHLFTLLFGLGILLFTLISGFYLVRQIAVPLMKVRHKIRQMPPGETAFAVDAPYIELREIEQALLDSKKIIAAYFQREQEFNRFASHEMRTPLMVLKGSADILGRTFPTDKVSAKALTRIQNACAEMTLLTDMFLLLGKAQIEPYQLQTLSVAELLQHQLPLIAASFSQHNADYNLVTEEDCTILAPSSFLIVVINNLLKNAFSYSDGTVEITLNGGSLRVVNSYQQEYRENVGYGYGLVIIERICSRMNWLFEKTDSNNAFAVTITFGEESPQIGA